MEPNIRRPILHRGEVYSKTITKRSGGGVKESNKTFDEAFANVKSGIGRTLESFESLPSDSKLPNELVFCVRMDPDFSAKSYYPGSFLSTFANFGELNEVGSRRWSDSSQDDLEREGKLLFMRSNQQTLTNFLAALEGEQIKMTKGFEEEIKRLENIDLLRSVEKAKERVIIEFVNFMLGKIEKSKLKSNINTHAMPVKIMSGVYQSSVRLKKQQNPLINITI